MIVVELPFPNSKLNPNCSKGVHWAATSALRKAARTSAYALARVAALGTPRYAASRARRTEFFICLLLNSL